MSIAENIQEISNRIHAAALRAGRDPSAVRLLAVGKTFPAEALIEAARAGHTLFGENYVQEAAAKIPAVRTALRAAVGSPGLEFHFIGQLQRNKVRVAMEHFQLIQTVDRIELAKEIDKEAARAGRRMPILLQVNVSDETSKGGTSREALAKLARDTASFEHLELRGLMSIGSPPEAGAAQLRAEYAAMVRLQAELSDVLGFALPELSMGMSGDFEQAIECGATIVRVGSAIFGERSRKE